MKPGIIAEQWESFAKAVLPPDAPKVQRDEMRKSFFAGVWAMLNVAKALGGDEFSEDEGVLTLELVDRECRAFAAGVISGTGGAPRTNTPMTTDCRAHRGDADH